MKRRILAIVAIVLAALAALGVRVVIEGRAALADGDEALAARRPLDAIAAWERAARWYLPGAPHVDEAYARLLDLAAQQRAVDLVAWRAIRSAALATRSLWTPHEDELLRANAEIARITSTDPEGALAAGATPAERQTWQATQLARDPRLAPEALALAVGGIVLWLVGMGLLVRAPDRRRALIAAGLAAAGMVGWVVGLYGA